MPDVTDLGCLGYDVYSNVSMCEVQNFVSNFFSQTALFSPRRNVWKWIPRSRRAHVPCGVTVVVVVAVVAAVVTSAYTEQGTMRDRMRSYGSETVKGGLTPV